MAYRASPPRIVPAFDKAAVAAAEAVPAETAFVSISTTGVTHADGYASGVYAILPDKHVYDKLRFSFTPPTLGANVADATLSLWGRLSDGSIIFLGESVLDARNQFPAVEIENYDARYYLTVSSITSDGAAAPVLDVTVRCAVQGVYEDED